MRPHGTTCFRLRGLAVALLAAWMLSQVVASAQAEEPFWVVSPTSEEPDLPPSGNSLFDHLAQQAFAGTLPFPFSVFLSELDSMLVGEGKTSGLHRVLIPAGRSLQRNVTSRPFRSPRAVIAVVGETRADGPAAGLLLRDRLFVAYNEPAGILEVISYNPDAGRFEFQIVKNYRRDTAPKVIYAPRRVCRSCHQNAAPIFSRGGWRESNSNRRMSAQIGPNGSMRYGVPAHVPTAEPAGIDAAVDRANELAAGQFLWANGCGSERMGDICRASLLELALRLRLTRMDPVEFADSSTVIDAERIIGERWPTRWPAGILLPDAALPNREPLLIPTSGHGLANHVERRFDPLEPRAPRQHRLTFDRASLSTGVRILGSFFSDTDVLRLDRLAREGSFGPRRRAEAAWTDCESRTQERTDTRRWLLRCDDIGTHPNVQRVGLRLEVAGNQPTGGRVSLELAHARFIQFPVEVDAYHSTSATWGFILRPVAMPARPSPRMPDGARIESLRVAAPRSPMGQTSDVPLNLTLVMSRELDDLGAAVRSLKTTGDALSARPLRRGEVLRGLGLSPDSPVAAVFRQEMPQPQPGVATVPGPQGGGTGPPGMNALYRRCAACHLTGESSPPSFLAGTAAQVHRQLAACAPRIRYRLAMWRRDALLRGKSGMPPALSLKAQGYSGESWAASGEFRAIGDFLDDLAPVEPMEMLPDGSDYEMLPRCVGNG